MWAQAASTWTPAAMRSVEALPDAITYNAVISARGKCKQRQQALELLAAMRSVEVLPDIIIFSPAISACEKGVLGLRSPSLLGSMQNLGVLPHATCCHHLQYCNQCLREVRATAAGTWSYLVLWRKYVASRLNGRSCVYTFWRLHVELVITFLVLSSFGFSKPRIPKIPRTREPLTSRFWATISWPADPPAFGLPTYGIYGATDIAFYRHSANLHGLIFKDFVHWHLDRSPRNYASA